MSGAPLDRLVQALAKLPGIGEKTATRLSFFLIRSRSNLIQELAEALSAVHQQVHLCQTCCHVTSGDFCSFCEDKRRDPKTICVVSQPQDIMAIEKSGSFRGLYHVLHGVLSPLDGIGPEDLRISDLLPRLQNGGVHEIVLATNANVEGDATAFYLARVLKEYPVRVTRLGQGIPAGGELEYLDPSTLGRAFEARREV